MTPTEQLQAIAASYLAKGLPVAGVEYLYGEDREAVCNAPVEMNQPRRKFAIQERVSKPEYVGYMGHIGIGKSIALAAVCELAGSKALLIHKAQQDEAHRQERMGPILDEMDEHLPTEINLDDLRAQPFPPTYNRRQRRAAMRGKTRV